MVFGAQSPGNLLMKTGSARILMALQPQGASRGLCREKRWRYRASQLYAGFCQMASPTGGANRG